MTKLADELERLIEAFHNAMPQGQGETGDGGAAGKALCQFIYDHSEHIAAALRQPDAEKIILPIIDQHGNTIGTAERTREEHDRIEAFVDEAGTAWTPPTAWSYFKRCQPDTVPTAERDAALARVAELEKCVIAADKPCDATVRLTNASSALLEGSKP